MEKKQKILQLIKTKGPIIPAQLTKELNTSILFVSAMLSELVSNNELKLSHLKFGGTPLYFLKGQEYLLQKFAHKLHEKEKKAYDMLKEKKILRDNEQEPAIRVALRSIKDFAVPLQVNNKGNMEIFWKWFLLPDKEDEQLIKEYLKPIDEPTQLQAIVNKREERKGEKQIETMTKVKEQRKKFFGNNDDFLNRINNYFRRNNIKIISQQIIRRNNEIEFIVEIPSAVGSLQYYCKAKNKKRLNDMDLASVYIQGQQKKLPVLFITSGIITKKAKEMLNKEFKGMSIKQL
jgi:hypothetical protein